MFSVLPPIAKYHGGSFLVRKTQKKPKAFKKTTNRNKSMKVNRKKDFTPDPMAVIQKYRAQLRAASVVPQMSKEPSLEEIVVDDKDQELKDYYEKQRIFQETPSGKERYFGSLLYNSSQIGDSAKMEFIDTYRNIIRIRNRNAFNDTEPSPISAQLGRIDEKGLVPRAIGMVRRKGPDTIDVRQYRMGDHYAEVFGEGMNYNEEVERLNLQGNRLTDHGGLEILSKLQAINIVELDLSDNNIGLNWIKAISEIFQDYHWRIERLVLEGNHLSELCIQYLVEGLEGNETLRDLSLARNEIDDTGVTALAEYVTNTTSLLKLDLHWNNIRGEGALELCEGLRANKTIKILDLSFNALGSVKDLGISQVLADTFKNSQVMYHVDISHNKFVKSDIEIISKGMKKNHTIMGIHLDGNECNVDSLGFVHADRGNSTARFKNVHICTRILGNPRIRNSMHWRQVENCWIWERWKEVEIIWKPGISGPDDKDPIYVHLDFDGWQHDLMDKQEDGTFKVVRMMPPKKVKYFFSCDGVAKAANGRPAEQFSRPFKRSILFYGTEPKEINAPKCNWMKVEKGDSLLDVTTQRAKPRRPRKQYVPFATTKKRIWGIPISLFKDYAFDTEEHLSRCFDFDWSCSKLAKIIKDQSQIPAVKTYLRKNYKIIRETYKYYASLGQSAGVWSIGQNAMTEFVTYCRLIDNQFKLSDLDTLMVATLYSVIKNNPRNPPNSLIRYQFLEILVRAAIDKYQKTQICENVQQAVEKLMTEHMMNCNLEQFHSETWRWQKYIWEEVDDTLKAYLRILEYVYRKYSGRTRASKPFMSLEEFSDLCQYGGLINEGFPAREIDMVFNLAMTTQIDELNKDRHFQMSFVEFLEAITRVAGAAKFPTPVVGNLEMQSFVEVPREIAYNKSQPELSLAQYLENMMPKLLNLCPKDLKDYFVYPETSPFYNPGRKFHARFATTRAF